MYQQTESTTNLPRNYLQFHENAFVSPLNLINVTHPAPISFGRTPHVLQQILPRADPSIPSSASLPHLQSIDTNKLQMYQFLAQRKLKEERWKKERNDKNNIKQTPSQRNIRSAQQQSQRSKNPPVRSTSAPKKTIPIKRETPRSQVTPPPIQFTRSNDPYANLSTTKQNEITDLHEQLLVQLRILHNPPTRENIIDETEQEKQRRIRLKRERIKRDSRVLYNAHQELKQIVQDVHQPDVNFSRLIHHHLNAYKVILTAAETLANEAPLKPHDTPIQQLFTSLVPVLQTLNHTNQALGLSQLYIDSSFLRPPPSKSTYIRTVSDNRPSPSNHLLPSVYKELLKKKQQQQRKARSIPSVLRPRSAESVRLPRTDSSSITRPTISMQHKTRARSHSPLPSIKSSSTIETPFHSRFTVDHILVKLAPRLLANYTGRELTEQIERARTLIPMFLVDNRLTEDEIAGRVMQMIVPRQQHPQIASSTEPFDIFETEEERARRLNIDVYQTQISAWEDEMSQIRQRLQNYRTNRLEQETTTRRTVKFQLDKPSSPIPLPENVEIHAPLFESLPVDVVSQSMETKPAFIQTSSHGAIRLQSLDTNKIRQIERYRKDYQSYLTRTESAKRDDFDPCQIINRLSEFLLDEALLSVVNEVELLTVELSQKLVENELLGKEVTLADVEKQQQPSRYRTHQTTRKQPPRSPSPLNEQYNTSSFEEDFNSESKISRSEDDDNGFGRKNPMEGTGRFMTTAFEQKILPQTRSSSSSSSPTPTPMPKGIIIKPTIPTYRTSSVHEEVNQYSDGDFESSTSTRSKGRQQQQHVRRQSSGDDEDENVLISMKTGEKIYSTDFEESKSKHRTVSDDEDIVDTMKLSARSLNAIQHSSFYSDEDD